MNIVSLIRTIEKEFSLLPPKAQQRVLEKLRRDIKATEKKQ